MISRGMWCSETTFSTPPWAMASFGMPKEAIAHGGVEKVVSLHHIPREIMLWYQAGQPVMAG